MAEGQSQGLLGLFGPANDNFQIDSFQVYWIMLFNFIKSTSILQGNLMFCERITM